MYQAAIDKIAARGLIRDHYDNFIGGKWVAPVEGRYFDNPSPVTGKRLCSIPRSSAADIELALDAAHKAKDAWGKTPAAERALILNRVADRMEANLDLLALVETLLGLTALRPFARGQALEFDHEAATRPLRAAPGARRTSYAKSANGSRTSRMNSQMVESQWLIGMSPGRTSAATMPAKLTGSFALPNCGA